MEAGLSRKGVRPRWDGGMLVDTVGCGLADLLGCHWDGRRADARQGGAGSPPGLAPRRLGDVARSDWPRRRRCWHPAGSCRAMPAHRPVTRG